jgi:hypothetical protein
VFRSGAIEGVDAITLRGGGGTTPKTIPSTLLEQTLIEGLRMYLALMGDIGVPPPVIVALSILGVSGRWLAVPFPHEAGHGEPIDR